MTHAATFATSRFGVAVEPSGVEVSRFRKAKTGRRTAAEGSSIGHKRIHRLDHTVETRRLRLIIDDSIAEPLISSWSVYHIED